MTESASPPSLWSGRTAWARNLETPLRRFLRTETGSAAVLLTATVAALIWVNIDTAGYDSVWATTCRCGWAAPGCPTACAAG